MSTESSMIPPWSTELGEDTMLSQQTTGHGSLSDALDAAGVHQHDHDRAYGIDIRSVRPAQAARMLSISRAELFRLLKSGDLRSVKCGRARLITVAAIRDLLTRLSVPTE
jgi:excisionase family DNA binding protein